MAPRWVLGSAAALVAAAVFCAPAGAIVGGSSVAITDHPYQVALLNNARGAATSSQFCGGSIRDEWHIITAAHCVYNTPFAPGTVAAPSQIDVLAGTGNLATENAGVRPHVESISYDPQYDDGTKEHDAALLTLAAPLTLGPAMEPVLMIDSAASLPAGSPLFVTGWGDTDPNSNLSTDFPDQLQGTSVNLVSDSSCASSYFPIDVPGDIELCAAAPGHDACYGDSGGPLVQQNSTLTPSDDRLVGIVSSGIGCANAHYPGIYTEIAAPSIRSFVTQANPPAAPVNTTAPALNNGSPKVGDALSCSPGVWTGAPSLSYQFVRSTAAGDVGVASTAPNYTVTTADAGTQLRCIVTATNAGGTVPAESARTAAVPGQNNGGGDNSLDKTAPVARIVKTKCTSTRCVLTVNVVDAGYSAGIKTVQATVTTSYRTTCKRNGKQVRCTKQKTKKLTARRLAATKFQIVASKLPVGKQLFVLYAVDKASHRQHLPTKKTVTTKRAKKR